MKKQLTAALAAALLLTGCGTPYSNNTTDLGSGISPAAPSGNLTAETVSAQYQFTCGLLQSANSAHPGENLGFAPVLNALGIAAYGAGASGDTRTEIEQAFGGMNADDVFSGLCSVSGEESESILQTALSFWYRNDSIQSPKTAYLQKIAGAAEIYSAPFSDQTRWDMNKWISDHTNAESTDLLPELTADECADLLTAAVFDAKWKEKYADNEVRNALFYQADGQQKSTPFMKKETDPAVYLSDEKKAVGFMRPYADSRMSFAALMPVDMTPEEYIAQLTPEELSQTLRGGIQTEMYTAIPAFTVDTETDLAPILKKMGIQKAYDPDAADFSGISDGKLYLSRALQQIRLAVSQNGTKATFSLNLSGEESSAPEYSVMLNRPFLWFIYDSRSELPVFAGVLQTVS